MDLIKINPAEYGLEETKAQQIEKSFAAVTVERNGIIAIYEELITSEITPEICERAGKLSTALSKVNASLNRVHKAEKLYYLSGGKFCDAIKNKNRIVIEEMQCNLIALKDHFENERKEIIAVLQKERSEEIERYIDIIPETLGLMTNEVWANFYSGTKANYKIQKEAEKKTERQRIEKEKKAREEKKRIIAENERLRLEAIERERIANIEATERVKKETERLRKENEAKTIREEKERKERKENEAKLQAERDERERIEKKAKAKQKQLEDELKEKAEAEEKRKKLEEEAKQILLNMDDAGKVDGLITDLSQLKTRYTFESVKNKKMYTDVGNLIDKIINHIEK